MADLRVRYVWRTLGKLGILGGRLTFPEIGHVPGIYSLRFDGPRGRTEYIGEAADLSRRWYSYSRPGPTQRTNLRLNPLLLEAVIRTMSKYGLPQGRPWCLALKAPTLTSTNVGCGS